MTKANIVLPDGTTVAIQGTAEEVAGLLAKFSQPSVQLRRGRKGGQKKRQPGGQARGESRKGGPTALIAELAEEGYFKSKRLIGDIQKKLEERGHIYPVTSISPCLTRMTKRRQLRRLKENKGWVYVN